MNRFSLAPMSMGLCVLSWLLLLIPLGMCWGALTRPILLWVALFILVIYAFIWLYMRPRAFEVTPGALRIVWPTRRESIPMASIERVEVVDSADFHRRFGRGVRIGAGGFLGGFGLLWTKLGMLRFYISRTDRFVMIYRKRGRTWMITPSDEARFVQAINARLS